MYIPEFVCGIGFTIIAEVFLFVLYGMLTDWKVKGKEENEEM